MDRFKKFLRKIDAKLKRQLQAVMQAILEDNIEGLDVEPLRGYKNTFRCRVRDVRIIFMRTERGNVLVDVSFRGDAYKDL